MARLTRADSVLLYFRITRRNARLFAATAAGEREAERGGVRTSRNRDDLIARPVRVSRIRGQTIVFGGEVHFETTHRNLGEYPARPGFFLGACVRTRDKIVRNNAYLELDPVRASLGKRAIVSFQRIAHRET